MLTNYLSGFKRKFSDLKLVSITVVATIFSYFALAIISNFGLVWSLFSGGNFSAAFSAAVNLVLGFPGSVEFYGLFLTVLISFLIGVNISLVLENILSGSFALDDSGSLLGFFVAPFASICSVCVTGIAFAGFSISLGFLPFGGLSLSVLSVFLLIGSAFWIIEKENNVCQV